MGTPFSPSSRARPFWTAHILGGVAAWAILVADLSNAEGFALAEGHLASASQTMSPTIPDCAFEVFRDDFETRVRPEWSLSSRSVTPRLGRWFLGELGNQTAVLRLRALPPHSQLKLSFDLYVLKSWDGNWGGFGPDIWDLRVTGGLILVHTTFQNHAGGTQSFPDTYPGGEHPRYAGATEVNSLGYTDIGNPSDAIYHFELDLNHRSESLSLEFSASGLEPLDNESWGLDNVVVRAVVPAIMPAITRPPVSQRADIGQLAWFEVTAEGPGLLTYQWNIGGTPIPNATNATLILTNIRSEDAGSYSVDVMNCAGQVRSPSADLLVGRPNLPPQISAIPTSVSREDGVPALVAFSVTDTETPPEQLLLSAQSSNVALVPAAGLALSGTGTNRLVRVTALANQFGDTTITVSALDSGGLTATSAFVLSLLPVNDAPFFFGGPHISVPEDNGPFVLKAWADSISLGPTNESHQVGRFILTNDNPSLFLASPAVDLAGTLTFTPAPNAYGVAHATVVLKDDGGTANGGLDTSPPYAFQITVQPVNDPPTVALSSPSSGQSFQAPTNILLQASASDPDGRIVQVEFFDGTTRLGDSATPPFQFLWSSVPAGPHTLTALATDDGGAQTRSLPVSFVVTSPSFQPPTVAITAPQDGSAVDWGKPLTVAVSASDPDDAVAQVELLEGPAVITRSSTAPWVFSVPNLTVGTHTFRASATDSRGLKAMSLPVTVEVIDPLATVAIVGLADTPEVRRQRDYLLAMDRHSRVFAPEAASLTNLSSYQLVIWSQAGRDSVSADEVAVLAALRAQGTPLYFVGERLAGAARALAPSASDAWRSLTKLGPASGQVTTRVLDFLSQPVLYIAYPESTIAYAPAGVAGYEPARVDPDGQVVARAGSADVIVAFPRAGEPDLPSRFRSVAQNLFAFGQDDSPAQADRQLLFQAIVCWLLRCPICATYNTVLDPGPSNFELAVGATVDLPLRVYPRYACVSTGVQFDGVLPPELEWVELLDEKGFAYVNDRELAVVIGEMGAEEELTPTLRLRGVAPGTASFTLHLRSHQSPVGGEEGQRTFTIRVTGEAPAPRMFVERSGPNIVISWPASASHWILQSSPSLAPSATWQPTDGLATLVEGRFRLVVAQRTAATYFRLIRP